jgi:hypothetical protein
MNKRRGADFLERLKAAVEAGTQALALTLPAVPNILKALGLGG